MEKYIKKRDFLKIDERDVLLITIPGRMGDEDGITFVVKDKNKYCIYRVGGWMYPDREAQDVITLEDASRQFPKWYEIWQNSNSKNCQGKYRYLYMGFGNGLCIDNSIYNDYNYYLDEEVKMYLDSYNNNEETFQYAAIFNTWDKAFMKMINKNKQKK